MITYLEAAYHSKDLGEEPMQTTQDLEEPSHQEFETSTHRSIQPWIIDLAKQADSRSSFNELMDTPMDFSAFIMNRLKADTLTPELLAVPKGLALRVVLVDLHSKDESGKGLNMEENGNLDVEWENMKSNSIKFRNQFANMNSQVHLENVRGSKEKVGGSFWYSGHGSLVVDVGISGYRLGISLNSAISLPSSKHTTGLSSFYSGFGKRKMVLDFENPAVRLSSAKE
nr:hypothetical protein [Tanacetum cinerariifolium]